MPPKQTQQELARTSIVSWLDAGRYPAGSKLPTIAQMAKELGMKQMPIRMAVQMLVKENLLETRNGVGVFVIDPQAPAGRIMILVRSVQSLDHSRELEASFLLGELYEGILATIRQHNLTPVVCIESEFDNNLAAITSRFHEENCDGVILMDIDCEMALALAIGLGPHRVVSADFSSAISSLNEVKMRVGSGIHDILGHAFDRGHRHFACLYADVLYMQWSHVQRFQAFVQFCNERSLQMTPGCLIETDGSSITAYRATRKLLQANPHITAIFACNDVRAIGAMHAIEDMGLRVGHDVSVIGFDDMPEAAQANLATVRVPRKQIGSQCVELLLRCLDRKSIAQRSILSTNAVLRSSLGPAPTITDTSHARSQARATSDVSIQK